MLKQRVELVEFANYHDDVENSLKSYFSKHARKTNRRFTGYTDAEVDQDLDKRLAELDMSSSLVLMAALEAAFRTDYLERCIQRKKDSVSRAFRNLYKRKSTRVNFEDELLDIWKNNTEGSSQLISDLRAAFQFRHWLAHGRYWEPKLGRKYDFVTIFTLASNTFEKFPLLNE